MEALYNILFYLFSFIVIITVIVAVHEFGHYLVAKLSGVKVTEFSIGFGKRLCGFKDKSGTDWRISLWPLGGYVKMFGDQDPASATVDKKIKQSEAHLAFYNKPLLTKVAVVFAGPFFNFLFAIVILAGFYFAFGTLKASNEITMIAENSRAQQVGLQVGDKIISIDGYTITELKDVQKFVATHPEMSLTFQINRHGKIITKIVKPEAMEVKTPDHKTMKIGKLGIGTNKMSYIKLGFFASIKEAALETLQISYMTLKALGQMINGARGTEDLGGPVKIAKMAGETMKLGVYHVLWFMAMLSINLGLINLLPIPLLDGGHLFFYVVEAILGKTIASKMQNIGVRIGFILLITLMIYVIINDIRHF